MSVSLPNTTNAIAAGERPRRIGILVHPTRNIDEPLGRVRGWAERHRIEIVQVAAAYPQRPVAEEGDAASTGLIVSIGGDGTTLAALHAGALSRRPVLGIACGSLGALANVMVANTIRALDRFSVGEWSPRLFPALSIVASQGEPLLALNDVAVVRAGGGQVRLAAYVDGSLFARLAGDGAVVSTPIGSSGYTISAGGPLMLPGLEGFVLTPLPKHGGFAPPLVIGSTSELVLEIAGSFGGARLEVDGQVAGEGVDSLTVHFTPGVATQVCFRDQEPLLAGLRRRGIVADSPRLLAESARDYFNRPAET